MSNLDTSILQPGDVVIVEMGIWIVRVMIWIQAVFTGRAKYRKSGHVIVVSHRDETGKLWGIEGRPGGIGWADMDKRTGKWGLSNHEQPKTAEVRVKLVDSMVALLGSKYDYPAYLKLAMDLVGISPRWTDWTGNDVPTSYICSAVADQIYENEGLANPGGNTVTRFVTPAEWAEFIDKKQWESIS
jgi:hypothetical protein